MRVAPKIILTEKQREALESCSRGRLSSVRLAQRAQIVLLSAEGFENQEIAEELSVAPRTVSRWRLRFVQAGMAGIERDLPRGGCGSTKLKDLEPLIVEKTTQEKPLNATHWSTRSLARELGTTQSMVHRVWQANGLKPHLVRNFKLSNDAHFEEAEGCRWALPEPSRKRLGFQCGREEPVPGSRSYAAEPAHGQHKGVAGR